MGFLGFGCSPDDEEQQRNNKQNKREGEGREGDTNEKLRDARTRTRTNSQINY